MDGRPGRPAEPEEGDDEQRAADACQGQPEVLGLLLGVSPDERLGASIEYVGADDRDHRAGEHDGKGKTGLASREAIDTLEYVGEDFEEPGER